MTDSTHAPVKIKVWAIGGAGCRALGALSTLEEAQSLDLLAIDTDCAELEKLPLDHSQKLLCAEQWHRNNPGGCGGDVMKGQRSLSSERATLKAKLEGASLLILIGGLGGGTATGGASIIAGTAHSMHIPVILLMQTPFSFEGNGKRRIAESGIRELLEGADALLTLPNDLLFAVLPAETRVTEAFRMADKELARTVLGIRELFTGGNLISADLGDLNAMLKDKKSYAAIGVGRSTCETSAEACAEALANLTDSPFLGGVSKLKEADSVLLNLTGGNDLTIGEVKHTLENASSLVGEHTRLLVGANINPSYGKTLQITAIAIKFDELDEMKNSSNVRGGNPSENSEKEGETSPRKRTIRKKHKNAEPAAVQQEFILTVASNGIFENTTKTIFEGENLDAPTFQRRNIPIDMGA